MTVSPKLFSYKGGVHPAYCKTLAAESPITRLPMPPLLRISMSQHLGAPAKPVVAVGDAVLKGQRIGEAAGFISAHVHAPTSGTIKAITTAPTPTGSQAPAIELEPDGNDTWCETWHHSLAAGRPQRTIESRGGRRCRRHGRSRIPHPRQAGAAPR